MRVSVGYLTNYEDIMQFIRYVRGYLEGEEGEGEGEGEENN